MYASAPPPHLLYPSLSSFHTHASKEPYVHVPVFSQSPQHRQDFFPHQPPASFRSAGRLGAAGLLQLCERAVFVGETEQDVREHCVAFRDVEADVWDRIRD